MTDNEVTRTWIIQAASQLYAAVIQYRDAARYFCTAELGMDWPLIARDTTYFAERTREARRRKKERLERLRALIPRRQCFEAAPPAGEASSAAHAFLDELLHDTRHVQPAILSMAKWLTRRARFDLDAAQQHLLAHIKPPGTNLRDLPPLAEDPRLDLIFKFVAAVFLQHAGAIQIRQPDADTILLLPGATAATITQARAVEGAT